MHFRFGDQFSSHFSNFITDQSNCIMTESSQILFQFKRNQKSIYFDKEKIDDLTLDFSTQQLPIGNRKGLIVRNIHIWTKIKRKKIATNVQ